MAGEVEEFDELFVSYFLPIVRFAERRLPDPDSAEDLATAVFEASWSEYQRGTKVGKSWLYRVASNKVADHYRSSEAREQAEAALLRNVEEPSESVSMLDRLAVREALRALPERDREIIMLTYWEGLTAREVSVVVRCGVTVVWKVLSRARRQLRKLLDPAETRGGGERA